MPYFDTIFDAADQTLDGVFAAPATYRPAANPARQYAVTASVRSISFQQSEDLPESWQGYAVELRLAELASAIAAGDEIVFGAKVYVVTIGPNGRISEPLDTVDRKVLAFAKLR